MSLSLPYFSIVELCNIVLISLLITSIFLIIRKDESPTCLLSNSYIIVLELYVGPPFALCEKKPTYWAKYNVLGYQRKRDSQSCFPKGVTLPQKSFNLALGLQMNSIYYPIMMSHLKSYFLSISREKWNMPS